MAKIVLTGGTGLIGKRLTTLLEEKGHDVYILSRNKTSHLKSFYWNISTNFIDPNAFIATDYIIHLAGENIAGKRWSLRQKQIILESRTDSTKLLFEHVKKINPSLKCFISASGIGYYGALTSNKIYNENDKPANDFISTICVEWENSVKQFNDLNIRTVIFRTGIVLSKSGGALEKIIKPIKLGIGAALGSGNQYMPWIHIDDLCQMYCEAIENEKFTGIYNAVAPEQCTNKKFTKITANTLKKPLFLPNIPSSILKIVFGELSIILLEGSRVSSEKIEKLNFKFKFPSLSLALQNLLK